MGFSGVSSAKSLLGRSLLFMLPSARGEFNRYSINSSQDRLFVLPSPRGEFNDISVGWGTVNDGHSWHGLV